MFDDEREDPFVWEPGILLCGRVEIFPDHTLSTTKFMSLYQTKATQ